MGWVTGWSFKKTVSLPAMSGDQTDLNYEVLVTWQAGMNADFSDIRFTDEDEETLLYQYRDRYTDSTSAYFWIKVSSVLAAGKTICMYFGNSGAVDVSDGANTFPFFDDFSGDLTKWTTGGLVSVETGNMKMVLTWGNLSASAVSTSTFATGYSMHVKIKHGATGTFNRWVTFGHYNAAYSYNNPGASAYWRVASEKTTPATVLGNDTWRRLEIRRVDADTIRCYFDETLEATKTTSHTDAHAIRIEMSALNPTGDTLVDYVFVSKLPQDGTEIATLEPGLITTIGHINREFKAAYEHTASTWGTAVEPGQYDEIKAIDLGPLGEMREINVSKESGYQWHQYAPVGKKKVEPEIKMNLRYSGREWSFLAQLMGLDTVGGSPPYAHVLSLVDAIDGADAFGTLAAILGYSTVGLRFEWPSLKPVRVAITGPDKFGYMEMTVKGIADRLNLGTDTTTDKSDFTNVTHMELNSALAPIVPFGGMRFRANAQGGAALDTADILSVISWGVEFERKFDLEHKTRNIYVNQWETAEPIENGIPSQKLFFEFGDLNNLTFAERFQDKTELKADALFQLDANYSILFEFPRLRLSNIDPWIRSQGRIKYKVELQPMLASATPTGMSCANWQVTVTDNNGSAYE